MKLSKKQRHWLDFLFVVTQKEIKSRYKRTFLGILWVVINPLLQMMIIGLIFQFFVPMKIENYFLFLFAGLIPWNFFINSLLRATPLLVQERSLIQKAAFPRELLVVGVVLANLFHTLINNLIFIIFLVFLKTSFVSCLTFFFSTLLFSVVFFVFLSFFTLASCLIVAALYVKFRDLIFIIQLAIQLLFYSVPVIYSLEMLPSSLVKLLYINPLVSFIELFRFITLNIKTNLFLPFIVSIVSVFYLLFAFRFFKKQSKNFDDWF